MTPSHTIKQFLSLLLLLELCGLINRITLLEDFTEYFIGSNLHSSLFLVMSTHMTLSLQVNHKDDVSLFCFVIRIQWALFHPVHQIKSLICGFCVCEEIGVKKFVTSFLYLYLLACGTAVWIGLSLHIRDRADWRCVPLGWTGSWAAFHTHELSAAPPVAATDRILSPPPLRPLNSHDYSLHLLCTWMQLFTIARTVLQCSAMFIQPEREPWTNLYLVNKLHWWGI